MKSKRLCYLFSTKTYDLITIGSYAHKVAKIVGESASSCSPSILSVQQNNFCIEPSALPYCDPHIPVNQTMSFAGDLENGVGVASIDPKANELILKNGDKYRYKNLVYSGSDSQWKDTAFYPGLEACLEK